MGTANSNSQIKEMKVFATLAAIATADRGNVDRYWNGVDVDNPCGMQISGNSMINSTCTISGDHISKVYAGGAAFIAGGRNGETFGTITGFDYSGELDAVVFFEQYQNGDGSWDNSTCWSAEVNCRGNPGDVGLPGKYLMATVNNNELGPYNLQIAGVNEGDVISLNFGPVGFEAGNVTVVGGVASGFGDTWSIAVDDQPFGELLQVTVTQSGGPQLDLWSTTIA